MNWEHFRASQFQCSRHRFRAVAGFLVKGIAMLSVEERVLTCCLKGCPMGNLGLEIASWRDA